MAYDLVALLRASARNWMAADRLHHTRAYDHTTLLDAVEQGHAAVFYAVAEGFDALFHASVDGIEEMISAVA